MKQEVQVYELLADGSACAHDVADEIGKSVKVASAVLSSLYEQRLVDRKQAFHERESRSERMQGATVHKPCFLYWRKDLGQ